MKTLSRFVAGIVAFCYFTVAHAGLDDEMRKTFNSMVNITDPAAIDGQSRGVITGGSMFVRNKISTPNLFSFKPPSLKSGCGGIDFFGGSFSFINAEEFQNLLQGIASNALGYAFQLAIDVICPTCAAEMKELQKRLQELSQFLGNSCEMGKALVNLTPLDEKAAQRVKDAGPPTVVSGIFGDYFDVSKKKTGGKPKNPWSSLSDAQLTQEKMIGNVVWKSIRTNSVAGWYTAGASSDIDMYRVMMSLSGTITVKKGEAVDDASEAMPIITPFPSILPYDAFFNGGSHDVYQCDDDAIDRCLSPTVVRMNIEGMLPKIYAMLNGNGTSEGIIAKLRVRGPASTFTNDEKSFISAASPGILGVLHDFAHDLRSARQVGDMFAIVLAQEMAIKFITEMLENVQSAVAAYPSVKNTDQMINEIITKAYSRINEARTSSAHTLSGVSSAFQAAAYVRASLMQAVQKNTSPIRAGVN